MMGAIRAVRAYLPVTLAVVASSFALPVLADAPGASDGPTPYPAQTADWPGRGVIRVFGWMNDNRAHFWRERERKQGSIVLAGDSLTALWPDPAKVFSPAAVANRGIGGDVSRGLLFRFEEDVLALHPKAIVMLIGTNDLTARQRATDTLANIEAMLDLRDEQQPSTPVFLCSVPASANPDAPVDADQLRVLNAGLRKIATQRDFVSLIDLHAATASADGAPEPKWFKPDLLHLSRAGYERWQAILEPALRAQGIL
jgi:lysophospholipase L1-like esterase